MIRHIPRFLEIPLLTLVALAATMAAGATSALAADPWASRTLLPTSRFHPSQSDVAQEGRIDPASLVAARGEREAFQLVTKALSSTRLAARFGAGTHPDLVSNVDFLRIDYVNLATPSTNMGPLTGGGQYADPLPPQNRNAVTYPDPANDPGLLQTTTNRWGGYLVVVSVPVGMAAGTYTGSIELVDDNGNVMVTRPFGVKVVDLHATSGGAAAELPQPGHALRIRGVAGLAPGQYKGAIAARGGGNVSASGYVNVARYMLEHGLSPLQYHTAYPDGGAAGTAAGEYTCQGAMLANYRNISWWANGGNPFSATVLPVETDSTLGASCGSYSIKDHKAAGKYDDVLVAGPGPGQFLSRVFSWWNGNGLLGAAGSNYVVGPFDEPDQTQNATQVPKANQLLRASMPGVRNVTTTWPQYNASEKLCTKTYLGFMCRNLVVDATNNRSLWNFSGTDEAQVMVVPPHRQYGQLRRTAPMPDRAIYAQAYRNRLALIQRQAGREVWTYNIYQATRRIPQLAIDAPSTDARLTFWQLARDGRNGFYLADTTLYRNHFGQYAGATTNYRNLTTQPISYRLSRGYVWQANGWGSMFYPAYDATRGLTNPDGEPVSSLRMESIRDGIDDATLAAMYRKRFGQLAWDAKIKTLFAESYGPVVEMEQAGAGNVTYPYYSTSDMAYRMEALRRSLIAGLAQ